MVAPGLHALGRPGGQRGRRARRERGSVLSRLGLWIDAVYRVEDRDGSRRVLTDEECYQFLRFGCEVGSHFDKLVLFGRGAPSGVPTDFDLGPEGKVELAALPYYPSLRSPLAVARAVPAALRAIWRGLTGVDVLWVYGPYPFSLVFVALALLRRRRVVLGVRQDTMAYYRSRLPSVALAPVLLPLWLIEAGYRLLSRRLRTTAVGERIARRYGRERPTLLEHAVSLTRTADVAEEAPPRDWSGQIRLLSVGRIEPEKAPLLMVEALAELERRRPGRFQLTWAGTGRLAGDVRRRAEELGIGDRVELPGYVPFGPELMRLYREAHLFVHVALTEGLPQVLLEAMSAGTPIVATDVGGVAAALERGAAGIVVPPRDRDALVDAVLRMVDRPEERARYVERGLEIARERTLEVEGARVAGFIGAG